MSALALVIGVLASGIVGSPGAASTDADTESDNAVTTPPDDGWALGLRAGGGFDSNVLHDPSSSTQSAVMRVDGTAEAAPVSDLRLLLTGGYEQHVSLSAINEGQGALLAGYRLRLIDGLDLTVGSATSIGRELSVFVEGAALTTGGQLRNQLGENLFLRLQYALGDFKLACRLRGAVKTVSGAENYLLLGGSVGGALHWIPSAHFATRLGYDFTRRNFDGLRTRDRNGDLVADSRDLEIAVHNAWFAARVRFSEGLRVALRYDLQRLADNFLGYLDGNLHTAHLAFESDVHDRFIVELAADMRQRSYPERAETLDNQISELELAASGEVEFWVWDNLGVFVRYQLERVSAEPTGLLYTRHMVFLGPAGRLRQSRP